MVFAVLQSYDDGFGLNPGLEAHGEFNLHMTFLSHTHFMIIAYSRVMF